MLDKYYTRFRLSGEEVLAIGCGVALLSLEGCATIYNAMNYKAKNEQEQKQIDDLQRQSRDRSINDHYDWVDRFQKR